MCIVNDVYLHPQHYVSAQNIQKKKIYRKGKAITKQAQHQLFQAGMAIVQIVSNHWTGMVWNGLWILKEKFKNYFT